MKFDLMIRSLLENDTYKFTIGQAIYHQFSDYMIRQDFKCRNEDVIFTSEMVAEIDEQVKEYCTLNFTQDELNYIQNNIPGITKDYIEYLKNWHPRYDDFNITFNNKVPNGMILYVKGSWLNTSMYETPVLAIVNEVYYKYKYANYRTLQEEFTKRTNEKIKDIINNPIGNFSEFGFRRRFSREAQDFLIRAFIGSETPGFMGTSNVYLAKTYDVKPIGTMAHEWIMCVGQGNHRYNPAYSNYFAMKAWAEEYKGKNGIILTDTITTDCFLKDFDEGFANFFRGVRHDSGDPYEWGDEMVKQYKNLNIDPKTKTLMFSDSLNVNKARDLNNYFKEKVNVAFGIGTHFSNDTGVPALNIVMKVTECNGQPVAKISDDLGKGMCKDQEYVDLLMNNIDWRMTYGN